MADDKGTSQLFGESLPGTGGDYIDTNDVEGHMTNKHITPTPPSADGGPDDFGVGGRHPGNLPGATGEDTEGHSGNNAIRHPGAADGGPDDFNNKRLFQGIDGGTDDDVEGHGFAKRAPGENPNGER